jgi:FkbM family methyltransferase
MTELLAQVLQEVSGAFLDVGVNLGQTLVKLRAVDPQRPYFGFEPNPFCVSYVQDLIRENCFEDCTLLPVGLFTEDSVLFLDLYADSQADSMASLISNFRPDRRVHSRTFVPVFRYGSVAKLLGDISVGIVKIDVEGAELEVVKSLSQLIGNDRPIIFIEVLPVYSENNDFRRRRQDELEQLLAGTDYAVLRVEKTASDAYRGLRRIERIGIHSDLTRCDYVAVPKERRSRLSWAMGAS